MHTDEEIISREEARAAGRKHFFTGVPCKHGHVAKRYVSNTACVECHRQWYQARSEYYRQWRRDRAEQAVERTRQWRKDNPKRHREYWRRRYATDPTFRLAHQLRGKISQILGGYAGKGKLSHVPEGRVEAVREKIDADLAAIPGAPDSYAEMDGSKWNIDHIVPLRVMLALLPDEPRSVLAYVVSHPDMLRPLPAAENKARNNTPDDDAEAALPRFWEIVQEARAYHNDRKELET